jgi:hypothetical protein
MTRNIGVPQNGEDRRKSYPLKLTPGKDDQLIEYLDSLPKGERQNAIKAALLAYINADPISVQLAGILARLDYLPTLLDEKLSEKLSNAMIFGFGGGSSFLSPTLEPPPADVPKLTADDKRKRNSKIDKAAW